MDPLSEVFTLIKPRIYAAGGFELPCESSVYYPSLHGVKCYAVLAGQGYLFVEGVTGAMRLETGDCFVLPRGLPFTLSINLSLKPVLYSIVRDSLSNTVGPLEGDRRVCYIAGGHFDLVAGPSEMILRSLPPVIHIHRESDKAAMRSAIATMREELSDSQPGSSLIAQHLACAMFIQALRIHMKGSYENGSGWLFALTDKQLGIAIASMHERPGVNWTLQSLAERVGMSRSGFAMRFKNSVGMTPMTYLTQWRMFLAAERLDNSSEGLSSIAQSLGYESQSAFGKAFRRVMGCSPRRYSGSASRGSLPHAYEPASSE